MKKILIILITLCPFFLLGQSVQFTYDDAGNRTSASLIINLVDNDEVEQFTINDNPSLTEDQPQSIEELGIKVYPNPTIALVNVACNNSIKDKNAKLQLYSGDGRLLDDRIFNGDEQLDLREYSSGIFYVHVLIGKEKRTYKVIKLN